MRILIRSVETGCFYAGHNDWVAHSESGFDFQTTHRALQWIRSLNAREVELIYSYGKTGYDIVVPPQNSPQEDWGL